MLPRHPSRSFGGMALRRPAAPTPCALSAGAALASLRVLAAGWALDEAVAVLFLGEDLLAWLVLAIGAALAIGTLLALVRPRPEAPEGDLERPPLARSLVMIALGTIAALWGLASLVSR